MPSLQLRFAAKADDAVLLANAGEIVRSSSNPNSPAHREMSISRLEFLYEIAFLQIFNQWEVFLEQSFLRYLCGYTSALGQQVVVAGVYERSLATAETAVLAGRDYLLWANTTTVTNRCRAFFVNGVHEQLFTSTRVRLDYFASIRNRIAHSQEDAGRKFDLATMNIAGRRYRASRPGRFLRDFNRTVAPPVRWLRFLAEELKNLATQVVR